MAGRVVSFYAPKALADAVDKHIREDRGSRRGAASAWFVEAARRDLRARGLPDGSEELSDQENAIREFRELLGVIPIGEVRERLREMRMTVAEAAGTASPSP